MSRIWKIGCTLLAIACLTAAVLTVALLRSRGELGSSPVFASATSTFTLSTDQPVAVRVFTAASEKRDVYISPQDLNLTASHESGGPSIDSIREDVSISVFDPTTGERPRAGSGTNGSCEASHTCERTLAIEVRWAAPIPGSVIAGVVSATATGYYAGEPESPPPFHLTVNENASAHYDGRPSTLVATANGVLRVTAATRVLTQQLRLDVSPATLQGRLAPPLIGRVRLIAPPQVANQYGQPAANIRLETPDGLVYSPEDGNFLVACRVNEACVISLTLTASLVRIGNIATIGPSDAVEQPWTVEVRLEDLTGTLPERGLTLTPVDEPKSTTPSASPTGP